MVKAKALAKWNENVERKLDAQNKKGRKFAGAGRAYFETNAKPLSGRNCNRRVAEPEFDKMGGIGKLERN